MGDHIRIKGGTKKYCNQVDPKSSYCTWEIFQERCEKACGLCVPIIQSSTNPSLMLTAIPSTTLSNNPNFVHSSIPSIEPSANPSVYHSVTPTIIPSVVSSTKPSSIPSVSEESIQKCKNK